MRSWRWAPLAGALIVALAALVVVLSDAEARLAGTNNIRPAGFIVRVPEGRTLCQPNEILPADAANVRVVLGTSGRSAGQVEITVRRENVMVADGRASARNGVTTIPITDAAGDVGPVDVCIRNTRGAPISIAGTAGPPTGTRLGRRDVEGAVAFEYLRDGRESWWALAPSVARRFGLGKSSWLGAWTFWVTLVGVVLLWAVAIGLTMRAFRARTASVPARLPRAALGCAVVAVLNGVLWSLVVPPFHVPDETVHLGYAQYVAEEGRPPPQKPGPQFSPEETEAIVETSFNQVVGNIRGRPVWNRVAAAPLDREPRGGTSRTGGGGASSASNNPPSFYALQAIPYWLGSSGGFLDRLALMRLLSALLAGLTTLGVFLFLRELLPGKAWAWTIGSLGASLQPTFGFISGGVNNDNLLFLASAWLFFVLARAFRVGLTPSLGVAIGAVTAGGLLAKSTMLGLIPAVALGVVMLVVRAQPHQRRASFRAAGLATACFAGLLVLYVAVTTAVWDRALFSSAGSTAEEEATVSLAGRLSYEWQFYLPPLPFMTDLQAGYPLYDEWFQGFIGRFGWLDYGFPSWVYEVALGVWIVLLALVISALVRWRQALWRRGGEFAVYLSAVAGLITLIAFAGYEYRVETGFVFEQARYLLPLLALYGGLIALVVLGGPARWRPAVAGVIIVLALSHDLFSQLLTISRYYG